MATLSASTTPETTHSAIIPLPQHMSHDHQRKKKATRACIHCQKAHLTCDDSRPCQRCIKRDLASTCADGARKKAKYLQDAEGKQNSYLRIHPTNQPTTTIADMMAHSSSFPPASTTTYSSSTPSSLNAGLLDTPVLFYHPRSYFITTNE
ncbi:hypothetical protein BDF14DRAFT_1851347 [Spinellus fusiger]|nr:hypothetical protein BDF14DRAFT_1851347 [Spinellus fusiger]